MAGTVGELLRDAAARLAESGSDTPRLDAELLLGHVLRVDRATLLASPEAGVGADAARDFASFVERRTRGEPVAYIRGLKEFYGIAFTVDARALIPRPETELLVDLAVARLAQMLTDSPRDPGTPLQVLDVGTGSGAIIVSIAVESRRRHYSSDVHLRASDSSPEALSLAVENAVVHGVADAIDFRIIDLADGAEYDQVDLLLANLPYIPTDVVPTLPVAASFEPISALDGGPDGLTQIKALVAQLPRAMTPIGVALLEVGADQADEVAGIAAGFGAGWSAVVHNDLADRPRVVEITRSVI